MIIPVKKMFQFELRGSNGQLGHVGDLLFDDVHWTIRYAEVDTGGWLTGRQVLVSPYAIQATDDEDGILLTNLSKEEIENGPDISTHMPISRREEARLAEYYSWPVYWTPVGAGMMGAPGVATVADAVPPAALDKSEDAEQSEEDPETEWEKTHLRSCQEVIGYRIAAQDDEIGHVENLLLDIDRWQLRYLVIDTKNWLPGKKVLITPASATAVHWADSSVAVGLSHEQIAGAPEYDPSKPLPPAAEHCMLQNDDTEA